MKKAEYPKELSELAENLAAIMRNPLTPVVLYNLLADLLADWGIMNTGDATTILPLLQNYI